MAKNLPPVQGMEVGLIPGWGTKVPHATGQQSPSAASTEAVLQLEEVPMLQWRLSAGETPQSRNHCNPPIFPQPCLLST